MPYETQYRTATRIVEQDLGFDEIPICRPKFTFFKFVGLRPSTPHWLFFDGVDVTTWVNTSYTIDDFNDAERNSTLRNPGDTYLKATSFPASLGGPTAASGPIYTDATGTLEGVFYIQSNESLSFKTGRRSLVAIDISILDKVGCLSYAEAEYSAVGTYELYYELQQQYQEAYQVYVQPQETSSDRNSGGPGNSYVGPAGYWENGTPYGAVYSSSTSAPSTSPRPQSRPSATSSKTSTSSTSSKTTSGGSGSSKSYEAPTRGNFTF